MSSERKRRRVDAALKAKVAVAAIRGDQTTAQIGSTYGVHGTQVSKWKKKVMDSLPGIFAGDGGADRGQGTNETLIASLYEEIGRLKMEVDWLQKKLSRCQ
jgi:transposase-like protein